MTEENRKELVEFVIEEGFYAFITSDKDFSHIKDNKFILLRENFISAENELYNYIAGTEEA